MIQVGSKPGLAALGTASEVFPGIAEPDKLEGSWYEWAVANLLMRECNGQMIEAEKSIDQTPVPTANPENAALLSAIGEWHALRGEWLQALQRFNSCLQSNQKDTSARVSIDYQDAAITWLELGNEGSYLRLRKEATARFKETDNKSVAERVLKVNLLSATDAPTAASLEPVVGVLARFLPSAVGIQRRTNSADAEYSMLLGLFEYRRGNYKKAMDWAQRSLDAASGKALPNATDHKILSMSLHQLGNPLAARFQLEQAQNLIQTGFGFDFDNWHRSGEVLLTNWRDWVFVRLLLREANAMISETSVPASSDTSR